VLVEPPPELYQGLPLVEPPLELLKKLLMKSSVGSSEATCEGYMMSKRVDRKVQSKVKKFRKWTCCAFSTGAGMFGEGVTPNGDNT
jgi:hypothetical protein